LTIGVSIQKIADETGLSVRTLRRVLDAAGVRHKTVGRAVLYDRADLEVVLGFGDPAPGAPLADQKDAILSPEEVEKIRDFVSR